MATNLCVSIYCLFIQPSSNTENHYPFLRFISLSHITIKICIWREKGKEETKADSQNTRNKCEKMLAAFKNGVVNPPKELYSPASTLISVRPKTPEETLKDFLVSNPSNGFSLEFSDKGFLAYASPQRQLMSQQR